MTPPFPDRTNPKRQRGVQAVDPAIARSHQPEASVLMLRGYLAPTGAMVNSQGLPAPGPRLHQGPRGWKPLTIFRCPFGAEHKQRDIRTDASGAFVARRQGHGVRASLASFDVATVFSPRLGRWLIARGFQPLVHVCIKDRGAGSPWLFSGAPLVQSTNSGKSELTLRGAFRGAEAGPRRVRLAGEF